MKLRASLPFQQLLFIIPALAFWLIAGNARAQQDALLTMKVDPQRPVPVKVMGVTGSSLMVHEQFGDKGIPLAQIQNVQMPPPPEVGTAVGAFKNKEYAKALAAARVVYEKYRGLPGYNPPGNTGLPPYWAAAMGSLIGDIYLAQGDVAKAQAAYDDFAKAYPGNGSADLGRARVAVAKKDFDTAKKTAEPLCEQALKQKNVVDAEGQVYGQAFLVLGQIKEAQGDYQGALEDYLRTVTLFYHDITATGLAQERADALRKTRDVFVP